MSQYYSTSNSSKTVAAVY